ncbi:MAG: hypothetical protein PVI59_13960 [Anaerolineae bacterium]|jgi:hypothetical protein
MYGVNSYTISASQGHSGRGADEGQAVKAALHHFRNVLAQACLARMWAKVTGRSRRLLDLNTVRAASRVRGSRYAGTRAVPIAAIPGSEGRCQDFDAQFRPTGNRARSRWMSVATAWQMGKTLPPVDLVQVGDRYFVRDGHHRISVARALGQTAVDAEVTVLDVAGPLPWERAANVGALAGQPA